MGGGDLNLKKSWHPHTMKNQEKVWKAEQAEKVEKQKLNDLQREIAHERDREDLRRIGKTSGVLAQTDDRKLEWMYKDGPSDHLNREDYLVGRQIDKNFEQLDAEQKRSERQSQLVGVTVPKNHVEHECIPFSIREYRNASNTEQVDLQRKTMEDPLMAIKQKEMESRRKILENPVKLKELHRILKKEQDQKQSSRGRKEKKRKKDKKSKKNKKKKKSKGSDQSDSENDLDSILAKKYKKIQGEIKDGSEGQMDLKKLMSMKYKTITKEIDKASKTKKRSKRDDRGHASESEDNSSRKRFHSGGQRGKKRRSESHSPDNRKRHRQEEPPRRDNPFRKEKPAMSPLPDVGINTAKVDIDFKVPAASPGRNRRLSRDQDKSRRQIGSSSRSPTTKQQNTISKSPVGRKSRFDDPNPRYIVRRSRSVSRGRSFKRNDRPMNNPFRKNQSTNRSSSPAQQNQSHSPRKSRSPVNRNNSFGNRRPFSPKRRSPGGFAAQKFGSQRQNSPGVNRRSPGFRRRSPSHRRNSVEFKRNSPALRLRSPPHRGRLPFQNRRVSPQQRSFSPRNRGPPFQRRQSTSPRGRVPFNRNDKRSPAQKRRTPSPQLRRRSPLGRFPKRSPSPDQRGRNSPIRRSPLLRGTRRGSPVRRFRNSPMRKGSPEVRQRSRSPNASWQAKGRRSQEKMRRSRSPSSKRLLPVRAPRSPDQHRRSPEKIQKSTETKRKSPSPSTKKPPTTSKQPTLQENRKPSRSSSTSSSSSSSSSSTSSSSSSSSSDSDRPAKKTYGLVTGDGRKLELKSSNQIQNDKPTASASSKTTSNFSANAEKKQQSVSQSSVRPTAREKLTEEEKKKKIAEMKQNAEWRDEERQQNVRKYRDEYDRETKGQQSTDFDKDFINKELKKAMFNQKSVESRIKSNMNNIQRSGRAMDTNFAKR